MAVVVAAVERSGCTFSGGASVGVVDDVGGGREGASRPFGCHTVMIAHARAPGRFNTVGPVGQRHTVLPVVNARGVRSSRERGSPRSINCGKGKGESLTSPLSIHSI
jgi:hypothetical protein